MSLITPLEIRKASSKTMEAGRATLYYLLSDNTTHYCYYYLFGPSPTYAYPQCVVPPQLLLDLFSTSY